MHPLKTLVVPPNKLAIHWFEQSSYALKDAQDTVLLVDPYSPHDRPADRFIHAKPPFDEASLPADYVILTHAHGDHTNSETIQRIWETSAETKFVGPAESVAQILRDTDVAEANTQIIQADQTVTLAGYTVTAVYAKPPAGDPAADINPPDVTHLGFIVKVDDLTLYFSGDPINTFAEHHDLLEAIAQHQPQIGFLTNHPSEGEFPFYAGCVKMAQKIGLTYAVPAHRACFVKRDYDVQEWAAQFPVMAPNP